MTAIIHTIHDTTYQQKGGGMPSHTPIDDLESRDDIIMSVEPVAPNELHVDTSTYGGYQRPISERALQDIINAYDPKLFEPVTVSMRDDGSMWVIDGHHRVAAAIRMGMAKVPARIIYGLDYQGEATMFRSMAKSRLAISRVDDHYAAVAAGDEDALAVSEVLRDCNFYATRGGKRHRVIDEDQAFPIMAIRAVYDVYELDKGETLRMTLGAIRAAWSRSYPEHATRQSMVRGIGMVIHRNRSVIRVGHLVDALAKTSPLAIRSDAQIIMSGNARVYAPVAHAMAIIDAYNSGGWRATKKQPKLEYLSVRDA